ncbi:hypothetical protein BC829DRAFT_443895 [Chytridium lagenaria]|nr:hypothetical protein BC829DRAFT_443895 [Chytridium lagenaria]
MDDQAFSNGWSHFNPSYNITTRPSTIDLYIAMPLPRRGFWIDASTILTGSLDPIIDRQQELSSEAFAYHLDYFTLDESIPVYENVLFSTVPHGRWITSWFAEYNTVFSNFACTDRYLDYLRKLYGDEGVCYDDWIYAKNLLMNEMSLEVLSSEGDLEMERLTQHPLHFLKNQWFITAEVADILAIREKRIANANMILPACTVSNANSNESIPQPPTHVDELFPMSHHSSRNIPLSPSPTPTPQSPSSPEKPQERGYAAPISPPPSSPVLAPSGMLQSKIPESHVMTDFLAVSSILDEEDDEDMTNTKFRTTASKDEEWLDVEPLDFEDNGNGRIYMLLTVKKAVGQFNPNLTKDSDIVVYPSRPNYLEQLGDVVHGILKSLKDDEKPVLLKVNHVKCVNGFDPRLFSTRSAVENYAFRKGPPTKGSSAGDRLRLVEGLGLGKEGGKKYRDLGFGMFIKQLQDNSSFNVCDELTLNVSFLKAVKDNDDTVYAASQITSLNGTALKGGVYDYEKLKGCGLTFVKIMKGWIYLNASVENLKMEILKNFPGVKSSEVMEALKTLKTDGIIDFDFSSKGLIIFDQNYIKDQEDIVEHNGFRKGVRKFCREIAGPLEKVLQYLKKEYQNLIDAKPLPGMRESQRNRNYVAKVLKEYLDNVPNECRAETPAHRFAVNREVFEVAARSEVAFKKRTTPAVVEVKFYKSARWGKLGTMDFCFLQLLLKIIFKSGKYSMLNCAAGVPFYEHPPASEQKAVASVQIFYHQTQVKCSVPLMAEYQEYHKGAHRKTKR